MSAFPFPHESLSDDLKAGFEEPLVVGFLVRMAPEHGGPEPILFPACPPAPSQDGQEQPAGFQPPEYFTEKRPLFAQGQMNDGIKAENGIEGAGFEPEAGHIHPFEAGGRDKFFSPLDLNVRNIDS